MQLSSKGCVRLSFVHLICPTHPVHKASIPHVWSWGTSMRHTLVALQGCAGCSAYSSNASHDKTNTPTHTATQTEANHSCRATSLRQALRTGPRLHAPCLVQLRQCGLVRIMNQWREGAGGPGPVLSPRPALRSQPAACATASFPSLFL